MNHRLLAALLLAGGLACGSSTGGPGIGLSAPAAVAVFQGITSKNPSGLHPYVAIANAGKDEIVLVDAIDDQAVVAPVVVRALSVPTPEPHPTLLLSASLGDGADKADLLVVVSSGSSTLQIVKTWGADPQVLRNLEVDLAAAAGGGEVLAITTAPVPQQNADGTFGPTPGRVRIIASLSGQRLAVMEYQRSADNIGIEPVPAGAVPVSAGGQPQVSIQSLANGLDRFEAVALAVNPADPRFVYAATPDPIPPPPGGTAALVLGVAQIDTTGTAGAWTWRALDARAPTTAVAAWRLRERLPNDAGDGPDSFQTTPVDRVYAVLDSSFCGPSFPIDCGIAVIDPVTGRIPPDPANTVDAQGKATGMPYLAPINVPAMALGLVISPPPKKAPTDLNAADAAKYVDPFMRIAPGTGQRATTAVAAVLAADGKAYYADLGRWAIPNDLSMLRTGTSRTRVSDVTSFLVLPSEQVLGLWNPTTLAPDPNTGKSSPVLVFNGTAAEPAVWITPGFTRTDDWLVAYQGFLPGLSLRKGEIAAAGGGRITMAMQVRIASGGLTQVVRLYSPELGVHRGDIVLVDTKSITSNAAGDCPVDDPNTTVNEAIIEARVADFVIPDAAHPGGSLVLEDPADPAHPEWTRCMANTLSKLAAPATGIDLAIRSGAFVIYATKAGYAGRPQPVAAPNAITNPNLPGYDGYQLRYEDEDQLSCPLLPWPADPTSVDCRDQTCRDTCERLVLARKARRIYYVSDSCSSSNTDTCATTWPLAAYPFPQANGPVLAFKLGLRADPNQPTAAIPRELSIKISTVSGLSPSTRGPTSSTAPQILPTGAATFDRSVIPGKENDGYRFYASWASGFVLDFSPSLAANQPITIR